MKKYALIYCLAVVILLSFTNAYASESQKQACGEKEPSALINTADMRYTKTPLNKLQRGAFNLSTCFLEVPASVFRVSKEKGEFIGFFVGPIQGLFTTLLRAATGIYDIVTFPIPAYDKPLMQPEYAFDSLDQASSSYDESYYGR